MLSTGPHKVGLRSLLDVCGLTGKEIDSYHIGFVLGAARQCRRPHEHARHRRAAAAGVRRGDGRRGARAGRAARTPRTSAARRKRRRSSRRRRRSSRPISRSARARSSSSPATAGTAASSASSRRSSWTRSIGRRSCCRSTATSRTGRAAAFRRSTCWRRSNRARTLMTKFGGHKQAAGLTIEAARIRELRARVNDYADGCLQPGRSAAAALDRRRAGVPLDQRAGGVGAGRAGAVRRRQSVPGLPRQRRRGRRRSAAAQGAPPQDGVPAGRPRHARHRLARRRARELRHRSTAARIDLAFSLEQDTWNGERYLQLSVADFRAPEM